MQICRFILNLAFCVLSFLPIAIADEAHDALHDEYQKYCGDWPGARWENAADDADTFYILRTADGPPSNLRVCNGSKNHIIDVVVDEKTKRTFSVSLEACIDIVGARQISITPKSGDPHVYGYYCRIPKHR